MGIHNLNPFLRKVAPEAFVKVPIADFAGKRIGVDVPLISYSHFSSAYMNFIKNEMQTEDMLLEDPYSEETRASIRTTVYNRIVNFCEILFSNGITPIFIFDGTAVPEKNAGARERREAARQTIKSKIRELREQLLDTDPLTRRVEDFEALRKLYRQIPPVNPGVELPKLRKFITENTGAVCITAPDEAEKFCAYLSSTGVTAASYTTDTDSYAFGARLVITDFDYASHPGAFRNPKYFECVVPSAIFHYLSITHLQFIDLCILFGCDFNERVPKIGPETGWKMIAAAAAKHPERGRLIEIVAESRPELDWEVLKSEVCRNIFSNHTECERVFREHCSDGGELRVQREKIAVPSLTEAYARNSDALSSPSRVEFYE